MVNNRKLEDRLSSLPEEILHRILSFIPTKQVITSTTLLSRQWRYLWLSLPSLLFHDDGNLERFSLFAKFIATTLMLHNTVTLYKFSVTFNLLHPGNMHAWHPITNMHSWSSDTNINTVNNWLRYATIKSVKELHLRLRGGTFNYCLPRTIFDNNVVQVLDIKGCNFKLLPETVSWGSLKYLTIKDCHFTNRDAIRVILKGSPKILCLDFIDCYDTDLGRAMNYHYVCV